MKMNYSAKGLLAIAAFSFLGITSCTDLEPEATDSIVREVVDGTAVPGNPTELVTAAYDNLSAFTDQANIYALSQHTSDEMIPPTRGVDWGDNGVWRTLHAHSWDPTHAYVLGAWNQLNGRLFNTVEILAGNPGTAEIADANFLQGFYMWNVLDLYGQVPFREFDQGVDELPRVIPRSEAIDLAIERMEVSITDLPSMGPGENTRGSKAAAYAMLTRMYLNKAVYKSDNPAGPYTYDDTDLNRVIEYADLLTAEGYSYDEEYFSIWEDGSDNEPILVSAQGSGQNRWMMTLHYGQNPSGWNGFTTISELYDSFDDNDPRIGNDAEPDGTEFSGIGTGFLQGQQLNDSGDPIIDTRSQLPLQFTDNVVLNGAGTAEGIRVIKYHPGRSGKYVLLRYAEAMLNKAEAQFRLGDQGAALETLNDMRNARDGDDEFGDLTELDEESLLQERARETYWEGIRRTDQIRFGTFTDAWTEKPASDASRVLFPIPQQAIDSNPNLGQNPGY